MTVPRPWPVLLSALMACEAPSGEEATTAQRGARVQPGTEMAADPASDAGAVNPAAMQLDFYTRSQEANQANHPAREVFDHFFAMEVTWR